MAGFVTFAALWAVIGVYVIGGRSSDAPVGGRDQVLRTGEELFGRIQLHTDANSEQHAKPGAGSGDADDLPGPGSQGVSELSVRRLRPDPHGAR